MLSNHGIEIDKMSGASTSKPTKKTSDLTEYYDPASHRKVGFPSGRNKSRFASKKQKEYFDSIKVACVDLYLLIQ